MPSPAQVVLIVEIYRVFAGSEIPDVLFEIGCRGSRYSLYGVRSPQIYPEAGESMADEILNNQSIILQNQKDILSNQQTIQENQKALEEILSNQKDILANQKDILANQKEILAAIKR
jgi:hypothetical protein